MKKEAMVIWSVFVICSLLLPRVSGAQSKTVRFEQLDSLQQTEKRPVVVFLYTSWCLYCSAMKNTTLKHREVERLLNRKFYFVPLDIEEKRPIAFRGHTFRYKPYGAGTGVHELAEQLGATGGSGAYPGICFLNAAYEIIHQQEGFVPAKAFLDLLNRIN